MSDIGITPQQHDELAQALAGAVDNHDATCPWDEHSLNYVLAWRAGAEVAVAWTTPHVERQVREQVAREIEDLASVHAALSDARRDVLIALEASARIARGDS